MENIDEDINILEELVCQKYSERLLNTLSMSKEEDEVYILTINERQAIENLLSRLKTAERMIELMAEQFEIMKDKEEEIDCFIPREYSDIDDCVKKDSCQECIIEYFRNKAKESE